MEEVKINATAKGELFKIDPRAIVIYEGFNSRRSFGDIEELAAQIKAQGMLNPITVQEFKENAITKYRLIDGERRYRAVMLLLKWFAEGDERGADIARVPALKLPFLTSEEDLLIQQFQRNEGKNFTEYEMGIFCKRMMDKCGYTIREVARRIQKNEGGLNYAVQLLDLDPRVQELLRDDKVSGSNVRRIYQCYPKTDEGRSDAAEEVLRLGEKADEREKKDNKPARISLKDLDPKGRTIIAKDSEIIKKGLITLVKYFEEYDVEEFDMEDTLNRLKGGELISDILCTDKKLNEVG